MDSNDRLERLLDDKSSVSKVDNRDLRWMILLMRKEMQSGLDTLQRSMSTQETNSKALETQVRANTAAVVSVQQAHDSCPLSNEEGRNNFVNGPVKAAVIDAVREANGTKPMLGPLNRGEIFQVLSWVIFALAAGLVFVATNGNVTIPLP